MNDFGIIIPLQKEISGELTGIASAISVDKDDERMSEEALRTMVTDIKTLGVNLFGNHEHNWENTLGVIKQADLINNQVQIGITLDDPNTNPKIPMLLNKLGKGIKLGLSVGGNVLSYKWEYDKNLNKKIKVLDKVKIYEVSVVGIPSNSDSFLSIPQAIAKSAKMSKGKCDICGKIKETVRQNGKNICESCSDNIAADQSGAWGEPENNSVNKSLRTELNDLKRHYDDLTTSDMQGAVSVIARRYGVDDNDCLEYIYTGDTSVFKSCPLCYSKISKGVCSICLAKI